MIACRKLPDYASDRPLPFFPWLRQIAWERLVELHRHHVRTQKRSVRREDIRDIHLSDDSVAKLAQRLISSDSGPLRTLLRHEARNRVREDMAKLEPRDREILMMRHLEQLQVNEIASLLKISEGAVKMRRLRAAQRLHDLLQAQP